MSSGKPFDASSRPTNRSRTNPVRPVRRSGGGANNLGSTALWAMKTRSVRTLEIERSLERLDRVRALRQIRG